MNTIALWQRFRWMYVPASLLTFLLQRSPVLRLLGTAEFSAGSPAGALLRSAVTVAALGGYHTLAGATQLSTNPSSPATATVGQPFSMVFAFVGSPTSAASYEVRGTLPPGLSVPGLSGDLLNDSSGTITGTPTVAGSYSLSIRGWNNTNKRGNGGDRTYTININVQAGAVAAPTITTQPAGLSVNAGGSATFSVVATGGGTLSYQWTKDGVNVSGATASTLTLPSVSASSAGDYRVVVTGSGGTVTSQPATLTVVTAQAPTIVTRPLTQTVVVGARLTLSVDAAGTAPLSYQWRKGGNPIVGATNPSFTLPSVQVADAAAYAVAVTNAAGTVVSDAATISVIPAVASAISNVSVRTSLAASQTLIVGFTMAGGAKPILVRAVGPGLAAFGVPATMDDPRLALFDGATSVASNEDWGGGSGLAGSFASVGAFPLPAASRDAALVNSVSGGRTAQINGPGAGAVLVEAYDAGSGVSPRLTNVSARNRVGTGANVLIAGVTISGTAPKTLLIRGVGPTLSVFSVPGVLADPKLEIFNSNQVKIAENDTWSPSLEPVFLAVGAFALTPGSKDAALVISLPPGPNGSAGYTIQLSGVASGTGEGLIEVYEVQP
ncbi:MAG: immunoglobulin domain-containing protein [Opitutaceae bacterium]